MSKYKFYVPSLNEKPEDAKLFVSCLSDHTNNFPLLAETAADRFHHCHNGWELSSWPIEICILDRNDKFLGKYLVDREIKHVFTASKC